MPDPQDWDAVTIENEREIGNAIRDADEGNYDRAENVLKEFSEKGSIYASLRLAEIMELQGEKYRDHEIEEFFKTAADSGNLYAQFWAGKFYIRIGKADEAFDIIEFSAEEGYLPSIHLLSRLYLEGIGCTKSVPNYRHYNQFATANGHLWAERRLCLDMIRGCYGLSRIHEGIFGFSRCLVKIARIAYHDPESHFLLN